MNDLHDSIRKIAIRSFVSPARSAHSTEFSIAVRDLMREAEKQGISTAQRVPAFCNSIRTIEFLRQNKLNIVGTDGPPSKKSTTVVVHYRIEDQSSTGSYMSIGNSVSGPADSRADRGKLKIPAADDPLLAISGLMRGAIREGAAAFLRELRKDVLRDDHDREDAA